MLVSRKKIDAKKVDHYRRHGLDPIAVESYPGGHMIILPRESKYTDSGAEHVVLPLALKSRTYYFVRNEDLTDFLEEELDEGTVAAGAINAKDPPVLEILRNTMEDKLIHPATSIGVDSEGVENFRLPTGRTEEGEIILKHCKDWARPFDYASFEELTHKEPQWMYIGLPFNH